MRTAIPLTPTVAASVASHAAAKASSQNEPTKSGGGFESVLKQHLQQSADKPAEASTASVAHGVAKSQDAAAATPADAEPAKTAASAHASTDAAQSGLTRVPPSLGKSAAVAAPALSAATKTTDKTKAPDGPTAAAAQPVGTAAPASLAAGTVGAQVQAAVGTAAPIASDADAGDGDEESTNSVTSRASNGSAATAGPGASRAQTAAVEGAPATAAPCETSDQSAFALAGQIKAAAGTTTAGTPEHDTSAPLGAAGVSAMAGASASLAPGNTSAGAPMASASVATPVSAQGWTGEVGKQLVIFTQQGLGSAQLHLNPLNLGPLNVHISLDGQQANIALQASHDDTRAALLQSLPQLREMFAGQGINLGSLSVGSGGARDPSAGGGQAGAQKNGDTADAGSSAQTALGRALNLPTGLVDIFA